MSRVLLPQDRPGSTREDAVFTILWIIAAILIIFWIIGLVAHILGAAIHILLVLAIIAVIVGFVTRR